MNVRKLVQPDVLARRIRMVMGGQKLSRKRLSEVVGISRPSMSAKLDGRVPFTYDELTRVIPALGVGWHQLLAAPDEENSVDGAALAYELPVKLSGLAPHPDRSL